MMKYVRYIIVCLILIWLFGFWYMFKTNGGNTNSAPRSRNDDAYDTAAKENRNKDNDAMWAQRLSKAESELERLETMNKNNEILIRELQEHAKNNLKTNKIPVILTQQLGTISEKSVDSSSMFSRNFEKYRRKVFTDIKDMAYYFNNQLTKLKPASGQEDDQKLFGLTFQNRINMMLAEMYNMSTTDKLGQWRKTESASLTKLVQDRFEALQNPSDCATAKKIVCDMSKACGFGCQMHHVMYCFITAYFMNRTMVLQSKNWRYNSRGYEAYFEPVSRKCLDSEEPNAVNWNEKESQETNAIKMPIIDVIGQRPNFLPLSVPIDLVSRIEAVHGDPFVWWGGNILSYLMRFNPAFKETVSKKSTQLGFQTPCVGIHVRRTDKVGTEADFHSLDEYMKHVASFFDIQDLTGKQSGNKTKRVVYLASDEVAVLQEAKKNYPDYTFIYDEEVAKSASVNQRYSPESVQGVILDIHFLSQCDYLVCTFSSQVCRMAYELMQVRYPDASWRFRSLDDIYYFGGQNGHTVVAIMDHVPNPKNNEIEMKIGDIIGLAGNHWNGFSKGKNSRTDKEGLFPSYKVNEILQTS